MALVVVVESHRLAKDRHQEVDRRGREIEVLGNRRYVRAALGVTVAGHREIIGGVLDEGAVLVSARSWLVTPRVINIE